MKQASKKLASHPQEINTQELLNAIQDLATTKGLSKQVIMDAMAEALKKAYLKYSGDDPTDTLLDVRFNDQTGEIQMVKEKNVVAEITDDVYETDPEEAKEQTGKDYKVGDVMEIPIDITQFQRAAAMQAKNVFKQKLREAEKQAIYAQYKDNINDIMIGTIERVEPNYCIVNLGSANAYLAKSKCLPNEALIVNRKIKVYVEDVDHRSQGTQIIVSRTAPGFVKRLMEQEISEIYDGTVEIKAIARNAGVRTKVAVYSKDINVDPSGACIGPKGNRINKVIEQIGRENIDVVNYSDNPILFIADALKPATIIGVKLNEEEKSCIAVVPSDDAEGSASEFSKAIGKGAQNVNLAVKLTGWKIDIKLQDEADQNGIDYALVEDVKLIEDAKRRAPKTLVQTTAPKVEEQEVVKEEIVDKDTTPVMEENVSEQEIQVQEATTANMESFTPTKTSSSTVSAFNEYEEALSNKSNTAQTERKTKKYKKDKEEPQAEKESEKVVTKPAKPAITLPVYTEEELADIEAEEAEEENKYDEEIDYDEFDDYYDK